VYFGEIVRTNITIAVKIIKPYPPKYAKYFEREVEFVRRQLDHPNVVHFFDYSELTIADPNGVKCNVKAFFMEYCPEGTFQKVLDDHKNQSLELAQTQHYFTQMSAFSHLLPPCFSVNEPYSCDFAVKGVRYLHDKGIVHRYLFRSLFIWTKLTQSIITCRDLKVPITLLPLLTIHSWPFPLRT